MPLQPRRWAAWALIAYLVVLGFIALWPTPVDQGSGEALQKVLRKLHEHGAPGWIDYSFVESASNVVLFLPFGALLVWIVGPRRFWVGIAAGVLLSTLIELAQYAFLPARYATLHDVAANTLGATLGAVLARLLKFRRQDGHFRPPARTL
jgi:glycopeptide antibiotics resistance protein